MTDHPRFAEPQILYVQPVRTTCTYRRIIVRCHKIVNQKFNLLNQRQSLSGSNQTAWFTAPLANIKKPQKTGNVSSFLGSVQKHSRFFSGMLTACATARCYLPTPADKKANGWVCSKEDETSPAYTLLAMCPKSSFRALDGSRPKSIFFRSTQKVLGLKADSKK